MTDYSDPSPDQVRLLLAHQDDGRPPVEDDESQPAQPADQPASEEEV